MSAVQQRADCDTINCMEPRGVLAHLKRIPLFWSVPEEEEQELLRLVPYVRELTYDPDERLLSEEEAPDATFLILSGRVQVTQVVPESGATIDLGQRFAGAVLGRTSLEVEDFERVTITAIEELHVLALYFRELVRAYQKSDYLREQLAGPLRLDRLVNTLKQIPLFSQLTDRAGELELYQVARTTHEQVFEHKEWVFRQGEVSDRLIVVLAGRIRLSAVDQEGRIKDLGTLEKGDTAGETGLLIGDFHDVTAVADDYARVLYLLRQEFADLLRERPNLRRKLVVSAPVESRRRMRSFEWLRQDEWVIDVVQRHWVRLLRQAGVLALILILLLPAAIVLVTTGEGWLIGLAVALGLPVLGLAGGIGWEYINWRDDYFVITTQRVVHIERTGPFSTQQEETSLDNIQDIYEVQPGLAANVLGYGNLILQSAGETIQIDMSYVPEPHRLRQLVFRQIERSRAREVLRTQGQIRELLTQRLEPGSPTSTPDVPTEPVPEPARKSLPIPILVIDAVWHYLFPPSRVEAEGGRTIVWRRYWLPGFIRYSPSVIVWLATTVGGLFFIFGQFGDPSFVGYLVGWLFAEAVVSAVVLWFIEDWRNDYFQLTQSHIMLVEQRPLLLQASRREARLDRIQNLSYEVPNIFARLFNFGHVEFETAGTEGKFILRWVRRPEDVQKAISNRQYEYRQHQREIEATRRQHELLTWFSAYDELQR